LKAADIGDENRVLIENFSIALRREGATKSTITWYLNYTTRIVQRLQEMGFCETLDKLDPDTFDRLLIYLEDERKLSSGTIRNELIPKLKITSLNFEFGIINRLSDNEKYL